MIKIPMGKHHGDRCFIIGSGPSIKKMDLSPLRDEITICVNESYRAIPWDPTFICIGDRELWPRIKERYACKESGIICGSGLNGSVGQDYPYGNLLGVLPLNKGMDIIKDGFTYDLATQPLRKAWNVIPEVVLPFVCWAGFDQCFLVGCDCTNSGYFYTNGARPDYQKVEDRTMACYEIISKMELPTTIINATNGGKLECFPRMALHELFVPADDSMLVIGYHTPNDDYPELAQQMKQSVLNQGLRCVIQQRPSLADPSLKKPMPWVLNCSQCGLFIRDMRRMFPTHPLLYLDADASMIRKPILFTKDFIRSFDFAAPFLTNQYVSNELVSNTLFFNATSPADALLRVWAAEQQGRVQKMLSGRYQPPYREVWDQRVLQDVLPRIPGIRMTKLPWTYAKMDKTGTGVELMEGVSPEEIVISQHQASRWNKKKV